MHLPGICIMIGKDVKGCNASVKMAKKPEGPTTKVSVESRKVRTLRSSMSQPRLRKAATNSKSKSSVESESIDVFALSSRMRR